MDKVYKALSDGTRRRIMQLLRERDMTAGEIAEHFEVTKPTLSAHFAVLREAGLVEQTKAGRSITYHLNASVLEDALLALMEGYDFVWAPSGDIAAAAADVIESLVRGDFAAVFDDFDSRMAEALALDKLEEAWNMTIEHAGPFVKMLDTQTERYWKFTVVVVACEFAKSGINIKITFSRTGKISGLLILNAIRGRKT